MLQRLNLMILEVCLPVGRNGFLKKFAVLVSS